MNIKFEFFNLDFHAPSEVEGRFDGQLGDASYLGDIPVYASYVWKISDHPLISTRDTYWLLSRKCLNDLVSANNLLHLQQKHFLEICPLKLDGEKAVFDVSSLETNLGYGNFEQYSDETSEEADDAFHQILENEINRWTIYSNIYQIGYAASTIVIYIEKMLISVFDALKETDPSTKPSRRKSNLSVIDGKINILREDYKIEFHLPPKLAETLMAARSSRNMFAHGDWENIDVPFQYLTARDLVEGAYQFTCLLFEALDKRYS